MNNERTYQLLTIGRGGAGAQAPNVRSSGGTLESYVPQAVLGAWVVDTRPAVAKHGAPVVFAAPLVDVSLPDDEVSKLDVSAGQSIVADTVAREQRGGFGAIVRGARAGLVNLDSVSTTAYVRYWRQRGALCGRVTTSGILWEPAPVEAPVEKQLSLLGESK